MKAKRWMIAEPDAGGVRRLAQEMHCAPLTAAVLSARGIENAAAARAFLSCERSGLHDPFAMHDMDRAVGVIRGAIERGERIVVYETTTSTASPRPARWSITCARRAQPVNIISRTV